MLKDRALWATGAALLALIVHLAVPFAIVENATTDTWWRLDADVDDPVIGTSTGAMLAGLLIAAVGWSAWSILRSRRPSFAPIGLGIGVVGSALVIHAQGLWTGRGLASLLHAILGSDAPPQRFAGADHHGAFWPVAPVLVLGLALFSVWSGLHQAARDVSPEKKHHRQARRHAVTGALALTAVALLTVVPWGLENIEDASPATADGQDRDPFVISGYDALRRAQETEAMVAETGEGGLQEYQDVARLVGINAMLFAALSAALVAVALAGADRTAHDDKVAGRAMQFVGQGVHILAVLGLTIGTLLVAVFLADANERLGGGPVYAPLLALAPLAWSVVASIGALRALEVSRDSLVADRFPEPIIYD